MPMFTRGCCVLLLISVSACSNAASRSPTAPSKPPPTIVLTGQVTDAATFAPISGATVLSDLTGFTTTDSLGNYSVTGSLEGGYNITFVSAADYEMDARYFFTTTQNFHLRRIERITAGESKSVVVTPDDTPCDNNLQDLDANYLCRSVRIVAPSDGTIMLEAVASQGGAHPPLEVERVTTRCPCFERLQNPTSMKVTAGTEVVAHVEIPSGSTGSQAFMLATSFAR
jgi:hypothetical protein